MHADDWTYAMHAWHIRFKPEKIRVWHVIYMHNTYYASVMWNAHTKRNISVLHGENS